MVFKLFVELHLVVFYITNNFKQFYKRKTENSLFTIVNFPMNYYLTVCLSDL